MDKGTHFHNCDFQVHTPRDLRWTGNKFGVNEDQLSGLTEQNKFEINQQREQFAKEYLQKARDAGLNAIAITDHHDVVFAKIIRKVSKEESREFEETSQFEKIITVFPGMELTLSNPNCQCIIIFDADYPDNDLDSVVNFLGLNPSNEYLKNHAQINRISQQVVGDLNELHLKLDELGYCKGKYIILPNVNHNGQSTILRQGFNEHYCKMPCVGGYVDGNISTETGYQNKINGGDRNYGEKAIGVLSTSDNRNEDGSGFGTHSTWVKWEKPTAEALRQACLARTSRISLQNPELPLIHISRLEVTGSKFLSSFVIEFNKQYNAIIGGRGTGKSTILEYLRWGLCDQTDLYIDDERKTDLVKKRESLIEKTLVPFDGEVRITFIVNGIVHIIKRNSKTRVILLKIGDNEFQQVKEEEIQSVLPVQAYSQKQLSSVGIRTDELRRFIEQPILSQLETLRFNLNDNEKKIRICYNNHLRKQKIQTENDQINLQVKSLREQVEKLRQSLIGISEDDQKIISNKQIYDNELLIINQIKRDFEFLSEKTHEFIEFIKRYPSPISLEGELINHELIKEIDEARIGNFSKIKVAANNLQNLINESAQSKLNELIIKWNELNNSFHVQYESSKAKAASNQSQINEIQRIEETLKTMLDDLAKRTAVITEMGNPEVELITLRRDWLQINRNRLRLLTEQSNNLNILSKNFISANYSKSLDTNAIKEKIMSAFQGSRVREDKIQSLCDAMKNSEDPLLTWTNILDEIRLIVESSGTVSLTDIPLLNSSGLTAIHMENIKEKLTPEKWIELALSEIEFNPDFRYTTNNQMGDSIQFAEASAGQQATALLTVLLNQPGYPLIIDQPEDDIDNRAIGEIISNIWEAKKKRQIIFTSHNANIVVNGDAELVACCDYLESDNQTHGRIKAEGAIDSKQIKDEITLVMEGGARAFKLRKEKYGF
ncbi:MAG: TrlF family AAA-like ATPase [Clostridiaceae bacterium]